MREKGFGRTFGYSEGFPYSLPNPSEVRQGLKILLLKKTFFALGSKGGGGCSMVWPKNARKCDVFLPQALSANAIRLD